MSREFVVRAREGEFSTRNYPDESLFHFFVPVRVWDGTSFGTPHDFLWDTGASFATVSEEFAAAHRLRYGDDDRLELDRVGGQSEGWVTTRHVEFPLVGKPRLKFKLFFFIVKAAPAAMPLLLGMPAALQSFDVLTSTTGAVFRLKAGHAGDAIAT